MPVVAQQKRKPGRPKEQGRAREIGKTTVYNFEMNLRLSEALESRALKERRTKKAVLELALEGYLANFGEWPPGQAPTCNN